MPNKKTKVQPTFVGLNISQKIMRKQTKFTEVTDNQKM